MALMQSMPVLPTISAKSSLFPVPIPCSPVQVPPNSIALSPIFTDTLLQASYSSGFSGSNKSNEWKLPSPTWPNRGAVRPASSISWRVFSSISGNCETGTHASVVMALHPALKLIPAANWIKEVKRSSGRCRLPTYRNIGDALLSTTDYDPLVLLHTQSLTHRNLWRFHRRCQFDA